MVAANGGRPSIALTLGDVAGIGPEVAVRAALDEDLRRRTRMILTGRPEIVQRVLAMLGESVPVHCSESLDELLQSTQPTESPGLLCWSVGDPAAADAPPCRIDARAGRAAYDSLCAAIDGTLAGQLDAIVTAPLNKAALHVAGVRLPGHTEILAERCGVAEHAMMLHLPPGGPVSGRYGLSVAHVTLHTSIASVPALLDSGKIRATIRLVDQFLRRIGCERPRLGVCALNPHAGEEGLFGDEETRIIRPAVEAEVAEGIQASGPHPADTLFKRAVVDGEFDGIAAMYHDQGHIAFKLIGFDRAVNVTLGLPIIRTSPSHGTAFDIAWQGRAKADGMKGAIVTAAQLYRRSQ